MFFDSKIYSEDRDSVVSLCNLKTGDVFIDCGANLGQEISLFSDMGIVFDSYEPHPYFFNKLVENFKDKKNVNITKKAVWVKNTNLEFYFKKPEEMWGDNHRSGGASLIKKSNHIGGKTMVESIDIVDVIEKHEKIKVLKIDIEGAEYKVLRKLIDTNLIHKPEFIFFEDHERKIVNRDEFQLDKKYVKDFVDRTGFKFYNW